MQRDTNDAVNYGYRFDIKSERVAETEPTEKYGSWEKQCFNRPPEILVKTHQYPDIVSELDLESGTEAYVVWAEWSYGDSFGFALTCGHEVFGVFEYKVFAEQLVKFLSERTGDCGMFSPNPVDSEICTCSTGDGQVFNIPVLPWTGYFERLEEVHIEKVVVVG